VSETSTRCMSLLHGTVGTSVTLELADPQRHQTNRFIIKREDVPIPDNPFRGMFGTNAPKSSATNALKPFLIAH
jgi:C-terminal processing protease CtpA/Prc